MTWAMQRIVIHQGASDIATQLGKAFAARGLKVVLAFVKLDEENQEDAGLEPVSLRDEHLGTIEIGEDEMVLTMQLALAAHVDRVILLCPEYTLGSSPAAAYLCSVTLSRQGVTGEALIQEVLTYLDAAHQAHRRLVWVQVVEDMRPWAEEQPMPFRPE